MLANIENYLEIPVQVPAEHIQVIVHLEDTTSQRTEVLMASDPLC